MTAGAIELDHSLVHIPVMTHVSVSDAKAQLTDLVRRAEAGEDVVLTRHGREVARITTIKRRPLTPDERLALIRKAQALAKGKFPPGFDAARSQDFLYGDDGLPE